MTRANPVDDKTFTKPLVKQLRGHVDAFAADLASQAPTGTYGDEARMRPCAVTWVYYSCVVAWAQDHGLVGEWLRVPGEKARERRDPPPDAQMPLPVSAPSAWLAMAIASLATHPATTCLLDPRYSPLRQGRPSNEVCEDLLTWWAKDAPSLAYDTDTGPSSLSGWLVGDLLQALSDERRTGFALAQTPWWVCDFIIDLTLVPAAEEFRDEPVPRTVDPACGTGHFLIRKLDYLWELYTTGQLHPRQVAGGQHITGHPTCEPGEAIGRILAGVHGMERDPLTAAVARLRMVVATGELMHRIGLIPELRLDAIPPIRPVVGVGDSLLWGVATPEEYAALHPQLADIQPPPPVGETAAEPEPGPTVQLGLFEEAS